MLLFLIIVLVVSLAIAACSGWLWFTNRATSRPTLAVLVVSIVGILASSSLLVEYLQGNGLTAPFGVEPPSRPDR